MAENSTKNDTEPVFQFIDRLFEEGKEKHLVNKLKESICMDIDSKLRKFTRDIGRSQESIPYERLVSHLESHIIYLEDELRKKDHLIEKLIDNNLNSVKSVNESRCISCKNTSLIENIKVTDRNQNQSNNKVDKRKIDVDVENSAVKSPSIPNRLIDFQFNETDGDTVEIENKKRDEKQNAKTRKRVIICGDSMVNGIHSDGVSSKSFLTTVKPFGGSTSTDMKDYIKPSLKTKPEKLIIHVGTNDLTKNVLDTAENFNEIVETVKELSPDTQLYFSEVCLRKDFPSAYQKVNELNKSIKSFCQSRNIALIENSNIDQSCLARKKLHLNAKGLGKLAVNFKSFLEKQ